VKTEPHSPEFKRFDATIGKLLAVPREEYRKRLDAFKSQPQRRGPKRKVRQSSAAFPALVDPPQA
jgi:hypothetical protein